MSFGAGTFPGKWRDHQLGGVDLRRRDLHGRSPPSRRGHDHHFLAPAPFNIGKSGVLQFGRAATASATPGRVCTFAGPSTFVLSGGIYNSGGETLTMGSAGTTTNSYDIGAANARQFDRCRRRAATTLHDASARRSVRNCWKHHKRRQQQRLSDNPGRCGARHQTDMSRCPAGRRWAPASTQSPDTLRSAAMAAAARSARQQRHPGDRGRLGAVLGSCSGLAFCIANGFSTVTLTAPSSGGAETSSSSARQTGRPIRARARA